MLSWPAPAIQKKTWNAINELIYNRPRKQKETITEILDSNGQTLSHPDDINEYVSDFFSYVVEQIKDQFSQTSTDPLENVVSNSSRMNLNPVTVSEVHVIINNLKTSSSPGSDKISAAVVKRNARILAPVFAKFINRSFQTGKFPKSLKIARGCIIHKNGDKRNINNYRPISVLSIFAKIWERALNDRLQDFVNKANLLNPDQYGFLAKSNTSAAATDFVSLI